MVYLSVRSLDDVAALFCDVVQAGQESYLSITRSYYRGTGDAPIHQCTFYMNWERMLFCCHIRHVLRHSSAVNHRCCMQHSWQTYRCVSYCAAAAAADGCLLVYDMTNRESFTAATRWLHEARENSNNEHLVVMVIANKADLAAK